MEIETAETNVRSKVTQSLGEQTHAHRQTTAYAGIEKSTSQGAWEIILRVVCLVSCYLTGS